MPPGERWVHEIKFDGYRVQVHLRDAAVKVFTRRGMTGRTALERSLVPDVDASTCLAGCPHGSNPTNTVVAALAADHYGRAIHKDELCAPRILHFPHQGLGAGNGTFCDHVTGSGEMVSQ